MHNFSLEVSEAYTSDGNAETFRRNLDGSHGAPYDLGGDFEGGPQQGYACDNSAKLNQALRAIYRVASWKCTMTLTSRGTLTYYAYQRLVDNSRFITSEIEQFHPSADARGDNVVVKLILATESDSYHVYINCAANSEYYGPNQDYAAILPAEYAGGGTLPEGYQGGTFLFIDTQIPCVLKAAQPVDPGPYEFPTDVSFQPNTYWTYDGKFDATTGRFV